MGNAHCRVGRINALPTLATTAVDVDPKVFVLKLHLLGLSDLWHHLHQSKACLAQMVSIKWAQPHQAVHTMLAAQLAIGIRAMEAVCRTLDASFFARRALEELRLEAVLLSKAQVHPLEHRCPILRISATGPSADLDNSRLIVVLTTVEEVAVARLVVVLEGSKLLLELWYHRVIAQIHQLHNVARLGLQHLPRLYLPPQRCCLARHLLSVGWIGPNL